MKNTQFVITHLDPARNFKTDSRNEARFWANVGMPVAIMKWNGSGWVVAGSITLQGGSPA